MFGFVLTYLKIISLKIQVRLKATKFVGVRSDSSTKKKCIGPRHTASILQVSPEWVPISSVSFIIYADLDSIYFTFPSLKPIREVHQHYNKPTWSSLLSVITQIPGRMVYWFAGDHRKRDLYEPRHAHLGTKSTYTDELHYSNASPAQYTNKSIRWCTIQFLMMSAETNCTRIILATRRRLVSCILGQLSTNYITNSPKLLILDMKTHLWILQRTVFTKKCPNTHVSV